MMPDPEAMEDRSEAPATNLVINALSDVVLTDRRTLADEASVDLARTAYEAAVDEDRRSAFEDELEGFAGLGPGETQSPSDAFNETVRDVLAEFETRGIRAAVDHRAFVTFDPREAAVYTYLRSLEPDHLEPILGTSGADSTVEEALSSMTDARYEAAADRFERAVRSATGAAAVTWRVLEGWAHFLAGNDSAAADVADEALEFDPAGWVAKLVWIASTHSQSAAIRDGRVDLAVYLKWASLLPGETSSIEIWVADAPAPQERTWRELSTDQAFGVLESLNPETGIRFRLDGPLDEFPQMQSYYLGLGTIETADPRPLETERVFETGPIADGVDESLTLYRDGDEAPPD